VPKTSSISAGTRRKSSCQKPARFLLELEGSHRAKNQLDSDRLLELEGSHRAKNQLYSGNLLELERSHRAKNQLDSDRLLELEGRHRAKNQLYSDSQSVSRTVLRRTERLLDEFRQRMDSHSAQYRANLTAAMAGKLITPSSHRPPDATRQ